jgi:hypothetical protein
MMIGRSHKPISFQTKKEAKLELPELPAGRWHDPSSERIFITQHQSPVNYALNRRTQEPPTFEVVGQLSLHLQDCHVRAAAPRRRTVAPLLGRKNKTSTDSPFILTTPSTMLCICNAEIAFPAFSLPPTHSSSRRSEQEPVKPNFWTRSLQTYLLHHLGSTICASIQEMELLLTSYRFNKGCKNSLPVHNRMF